MERLTEMAVITISRQYGSGGSEVAQKVATALGWELVDNAIVEAVAARLGMSEDDLRRYDELMDASNAVVDLVHSGKLDEAEAAARDLLARFPDEHDGWDRLGMAHQARGENSQAAECYRNVLDVVRRRAGDYEPAFEQKFITLIDRLDPPSATS